MIASSSSCSCQRPENVAAKARMTQPSPPDKHVAAASETIDVDGLVDAEGPAHALDGRSNGGKVDDHLIGEPATIDTRRVAFAEREPFTDGTKRVARHVVLLR